MFTEKLSFYLTANGITDEDKQRAILLSACGITTYKLPKTLVAPIELTSKSFSDLIKLAQEHHNLKPSVIMRRFHFNTCVRQEGESMTAYVTSLLDLASHCEYGDSAKEPVRDRLVYVVRDDTLQRALIAVAKGCKHWTVGQDMFHLLKRHFAVAPPSTTGSGETTDLSGGW